MHSVGAVFTSPESTVTRKAHAYFLQLIFFVRGFARNAPKSFRICQKPYNDTNNIHVALQARNLEMLRIRMTRPSLVRSTSALLPITKLFCTSTHDKMVLKHLQVAPVRSRSKSKRSSFSSKPTTLH